MALLDPTEGLEELLSLSNLMLNSAKLVAVSQGKYIARLAIPIILVKRGV
jgi:hypothetical protein